MTTTLLLHSLLYGLGMSIILGILVIVSLRINPEMWLEDYPPEIQKTYGEMSTRSKSHKGIVSIFFLVGTFVPIIASIIHLDNMFSESLTFGMVFWNVIIIMLVFNIFDLLILDWLMFVGIAPDFLILTGTEDQPAYKDYVFHAKGFAKGILIAIILAVITAGITQLF